MWGFKAKKRTISMLEEFVYLSEKGTPVGDNFGKFPQNDLGNLLNRLVDSYRRSTNYKDSISLQREQVVKDAQENIRRKRQLTQNISHELKTPVSALMGYLETILNNPDMEREQMLHFLRKSYQQSERLSDLLKDLSTITRIEEAADQIEKEICNLSDIIVDVIRDLEASYPASKGMIICDIPDNMSIFGNKSLLQSIFHNLLENAILYAQATSITVKLVSQSNSEYKMAVTDNGVGVEEKHLSLIFERFYRVDKGRSRKLGGTGLGLSIVKNGVILHGGNIEAVLVPSGGLSFLFSLSKGGEDAALRGTSM